MVPRKNRPVLFEVVSRTQRKVTRPVAPRPAAPPAPAAAASAPSPPTPAPAAGPVPAFLPAPRPRRPRTGWLSLEGSRIQLALGWPEAVTAAVIVLVLLAFSYYLGRRSMQPATPPPADVNELLGVAPREPAAAPPPAPLPGGGRTSGKPVTPFQPPVEEPKPQVIAPPGPQPAIQLPPANPPPSAPRTANPPPAAARPPEKPAEATPLAENAVYVVVQHFRTRDRAHAEAARDYLRSKGLNAVVQPGNRELLLVITDAFDSEAAAQNAVRRVREIGQEYEKAGGGYDFAGVRARKL